MRIVRRLDHYKVESSSPGVYYDVWPEKPFCSCPAFKFKNTKGGGMCKHLEAVREMVLMAGKKGHDKILNEIAQKGQVDSLELVKKYGEEAINDLIHMGEIIEENGKIRLLK